MNPNLENTIKFFSGMFTVVMALALTESFKQFIAERETTLEKGGVHRERLPPLISFLFLLFPFYHGMNRYFFTTYGNINTLPNPYSLFLMFDGVMFTIESALFFVMSRALLPAQWRRYNVTVVSLLIVDSVWGIVARLGHGAHGAPTLNWVALNIGFGFLIVLLLLFFRRDEPVIAGSCGMGIVIVRTFLDYHSNWDFYFPAP